MSWDRYHSLSELLAVDAESARRAGDVARAEALYRDAAAAEDNAFAQLPTEKHRTRAITAVSSVALWYKAHDYTAAERLAHRYLAGGDLLAFGVNQLRDLLYQIWAAQAAERAGVRFVPGDVLVSVKGGRVIHGGAPLDLIVKMVEGVQAVLLRTVEMLLRRPFRRHGGPASDILSMFRPWLFQAPAGSYQFAVRVQEPEQRDLWEAQRPHLDQVTATFFGILRASASDPDGELESVVPDSQYREAFLSLSRNLAPTGKTFERLEVRDAGAPAEPVAVLLPDTRQQINAALRRVKGPKQQVANDEPATIHGILRAVHLDRDWLEVATTDFPTGNIRVDDASEALDDVVGPMVNRRVVVTAVRRGQRYLYRDIEPEE